MGTTATIDRNKGGVAPASDRFVENGLIGEKLIDLKTVRAIYRPSGSKATLSNQGCDGGLLISIE
jgi:hypothetical protein